MANESISVTFEGLTDVEKALTEASPKLARRSLRNALKTGITVIQDAIDERTPVKTGELKENLQSSVSINKDLKGGRATVNFGDKGYIARFVELGHKIVVGGSKKNGKHIGDVAPHPFMRPAYEESAEAAIEAFAESLSAGLTDLEGRK